MPDIEMHPIYIPTKIIQTRESVVISLYIINAVIANEMLDVSAQHSIVRSIITIHIQEGSRMKKIVTVVLIGVATLFFTACGGGGSDSSGNTPAPATTINLVGTWKVTMATGGSVCDGLIAESIEVIESLNGDPNVIGTITIDGINFGVSSGGMCQLVPMNTVDTTAAGTPSNMSKAEFENWGSQRLAGIGSIESFVVTNYNNFIISIQVNFTNGVVMYEDLTRQ